MLISIVFSFRNEEENIRELVRRVSAAIAGGIEDLSYELIFVNDDSSDRSLEILLELQRTNPIKIINMSRRFGVTPCVLAGFSHAKGDGVIYMDSDLQDPPELIPQMIERFRDGAEVVHTVRTHRDGESAIKMWATKQAYRALNYFADVHLPENAGDFKLLSRKVVQAMLNLPEYDPYMRGLSVWVGYRQDFIYYRRQSRFSGQTHFLLFDKAHIREFVRGLTAFSAAPLYFAFYLGIATFLLSLILIVYAIILKITGFAAPGTSGVLTAVAFFSGIILVTNGLIGLYVARIYNEVKRRPQYIIKDVIAPENGDMTKSA